MEEHSNELVRVEATTIGGVQVQSVDARELHGFLAVGKDFSTWIRARIEQYGFVEGADFATIAAAPQNGGAGNRGVRIEYAITLDMAKELAMVERNEQGKRARQYFIECERRLVEQPDPMKALSDPATMRGLLLTYSEKVLSLEATVAQQAVVVKAHDRIAGAEGTLCMRDAAKNLQVRPTDLKALLIARRWIYGRPGHSGWLAYQDKIQQGLLMHKLETIQRSDGSDKIVEHLRVTPKGVAKLAELINAGAIARVAA